MRNGNDYEKLAADERRLAICARIEKQIERIASKHPGLSLRELITKLPEPDATRLAEMVDEVEIQSREYSAVEAKR